MSIALNTKWFGKLGGVSGLRHITVIGNEDDSYQVREPNGKEWSAHEDWFGKELTHVPITINSLWMWGPRPLLITCIENMPEALSVFMCDSQLSRVFYAGILWQLAPIDQWNG